jgi:hypothetical protein
MEAAIGGHGGQERRKKKKEAMEVGKGGIEVIRRSWRQKKEDMEAEKGGHGSKKRRTWR